MTIPAAAAAIAGYVLLVAVLAPGVGRRLKRNDSFYPAAKQEPSDSSRQEASPGSQTEGAYRMDHRSSDGRPGVVRRVVRVSIDDTIFGPKPGCRTSHALHGPPVRRRPLGGLHWRVAA